VTINFGCQDYACFLCFPPNDTNETDAVECDQSSVSNECATYVASVESTTGVCAIIDGDASSAAIANCFPQTDADNVSFVNVFCGTGP